MSSIRVFVNERPVDVPAGASVAAAVAGLDAALGDELASGTARATDARGIEVDPAAVVHAGAIFRVVARRTGADAHA